MRILGSRFIAVSMILGGVACGQAARAQLSESQVNPKNLSVLWECKGKYSGRQVNLRAWLSDFNPLLYVESSGINRFISERQAFQKDHFQTLGGIAFLLRGRHQSRSLFSANPFRIA